MNKIEEMKKTGRPLTPAELFLLNKNAEKRRMKICYEAIIKFGSDSRWSSLGFFDSEENALHCMVEFGIIIFLGRIKKATTEETEQALRPLFLKSNPKPTGKIIQVRADVDPLNLSKIWSQTFYRLWSQTFYSV